MRKVNKGVAKVERETYFFVYKRGTEIIIVHGVVRMDYYSEVMTLSGGTGIQGGAGLFCNTLEEAFDVEDNFEELFDNTKSVEEFAPKKQVSVEVDKLLDFEAKVVENGFTILSTDKEEDDEENGSETGFEQKIPSDGQVPDSSVPM